MMKLGLCGWIDAQPAEQPKILREQLSAGDPSGAIARGDTLQYLARAITLVRERGSLKAIETFEQVKFLVDTWSSYGEEKTRRGSG